MSTSGRLIGTILIALGLIVCFGGSAVSFFSTRNVETGGTGGLVLGLVLSVLIAAPLAAGGIYMIIRGRAEEAEMADVTRQRKILNMVETRGQVEISQLVLELKVNIDQVRNDIYKLVGLGLFTGYVNWDDGILYSRAASQLAGNTCPNCGGTQEFAGKGVIKCKYCGAEIFL
jgi:hypothetical protein